MRSILAAVLCLIALALPAQAAKCEMTTGGFLYRANASQAKVFVASARAVPIILAKLTEVGASKGLPPVKGDTIYVVFTKSEGEPQAGLFVFNAGCIVKDAVVILPASQMVKAMALLGLQESDFAEQSGT